ncbi:GntR family transcriptional regulator [Streptomyces sp. SAJ15]|uniref:GntR family transcriptional regulator n=1 Tax=Streptomyces sp. SAJ15 TaxID=2011095 RepID=UPI001184FD24|nr:GntR family transcriptional regulator [Streptomyces sp. SAJ15]TVL89715.1 hypothetical protein CD790_25260 [Streptomyces sp. SAJ15]
MAKSRAVYRRVAADLERRITGGEWRPGEQIPSRTALADQYHVHEQTMRLAVTLLRRQGVLEGEQRRRLFVAYPPAVRALANPNAPWPFGSETSGIHSCRATTDLAARLDVPVGTILRRETQECWDPGGRSAMLITSWWRGLRRRHLRFVAEVATAGLDEAQAHALRMPQDSLVYRLTRTRLDAEGRPVETADLILPMDRWTIRIGPHDGDAAG